MGCQPIEELLPQSNWSIYGLVRMASERAIELADGKPCLIKKPGADKETTIALNEILAGKLVFKSVAEKFKPEDKK